MIFPALVLGSGECLLAVAIGISTCVSSSCRRLQQFGLELRACFRDAEVLAGHGYNSQARCVCPRLHLGPSCRGRGATGDLRARDEKGWHPRGAESRGQGRRP